MMFMHKLLAYYLFGNSLVLFYIIYISSLLQFCYLERTKIYAYYNCLLPDFVNAVSLVLVHVSGCFSSKLCKPSKGYRNKRPFSEIMEGLMVAVFWTHWCSSSMMTSSLWSYRHSPDDIRMPQLWALHMQDNIQREGRKRTFCPVHIQFM